MDTASEIVRKLREGQTTPTRVFEETLAAIEAWEPRIHAWVLVDNSGAELDARNLEAHGDYSLPLSGVPVGVKDIIDVASLPTLLGAPDFAGYLPSSDSNIVEHLRAAGAIIMGKTVTTQFAYLDPPVTRNPWNPEHTPGGSSSGSAASVGAGTIPVALGTQTVGSVLRPAVFCGGVGFKPSYEQVSLAGVFPLSQSLDHIGIFTRSVGDTALVYGVATGSDEPFEASARPPRLAYARSYGRGIADEAMLRHIESVAESLAAAGALITEIDMPASAESILLMGQPMLSAEAAANHAALFADHADGYRPNIRALVEAGLQTLAVDYLESMQTLYQLRYAFAQLLAPYDAILMPVAVSTAPSVSAGVTGAAIFNAPASFTGLPAISLPSGLSEDRLPLGVQLMGAPGEDTALLSTSAWVERVLAFEAEPPRP